MAFHFAFIFLKRRRAYRLFFMEFSTLADSWMFLLPFSSLFFKLCVVSVMS